MYNDEEALVDWLKYLKSRDLNIFAEDQFHLEGEAGLSLDGTPVLSTPRSVDDILDSIPEYIGTGGASYYFVASNGEVIVFLEDWLSGCIPKQFYNKYPTGPYQAVEVRDYCINAMIPRRDAINEVLSQEGFRLVVDEPLVCDDAEDADLGEECSTRFAWVKV